MSQWRMIWTHPISFNSWNFAVVVTHEDNDWNADRTTRVKYLSLTQSQIGGNQESGMQITAIALGY